MPTTNLIVYTIFIIFAGAAVVATLVLYTRQSLLVAYMLLGVLIGPFGLKWVADSELIKQASEIGIIFLLFLLGLNLHPQKLFHMLRKATIVAIVSSLIFAVIGYVIALAFDFNQAQSIVIGCAMMFSSTIIGLKLLPTTILHHRHTGEVMISILLLQDILAIIVMLFITGSVQGQGNVNLLLIGLALPLLIAMAFLIENFILNKLFAKFDHIKEYVFLVSIAWCLGMAELAGFMGLSQEIGAFIAGVSIAASPIALYIAESLKPLRDFFLVMFFFTIGANFDLDYLSQVIIPALILGGVALLLKPLVFRFLLQRTGESKELATEVGIRLGQASEFSLLVAYLASSGINPLLTDKANYLIQAMTIITFFVSSYWVVWVYPTPLALTEQMRKD